MTIFMIEVERWVGEDYYSRDMYEDVLEPDIGYFTTYEDAQAFVDKAKTKAREDFEAEHARVVKSNEAIEVKRAKMELEYQDLKSIAVEKGLSVQIPRPALPYASALPRWKEPSYTIIEVEPHEN